MTTILSSYDTNILMAMILFLDKELFCFLEVLGIEPRVVYARQSDLPLNYIPRAWFYF